MNGAMKSSGASFIGVLGLALLAAAGPAWGEAGRVLYVTGQATLVRGDEVPVTKGMAVVSGDTLVTGDNGRVQLLMADGDRIALRPRTRFTIDEFSGPSRDKPGQPVAARPSAWKSFYSLARGGIRTLTQSLGQRDSSSYQVRTPVATIGIRGTDYTLLYCPAGCAEYQGKVISRNEIKVDGLRARVFRDSAGSRLLFAALGFAWVNEFLKADQHGGGGGGGGGGELLGGVSDGEIEITGSDGSANVVGRSTFFRATPDGGFQILPEAPEGLGDQTPNEGGEGEFGGEGDGSEGEGGSGENTGEGDGTVGDVTMEFGTADTGSTDAGEPPAQDIGTQNGSITNGQRPPARPQGFHGLSLSQPPHQLTQNGAGPTPQRGGVGASYVPLSIGTDGAGRITSLRSATSQGGQTVVDTLTLRGASVNAGFDAGANTGLRWGRWTGSYEQLITVNGVEQARREFNLGENSLHIIHGPSTGTGEPPVIQVTGSYTYSLIGNTDPTDSNGNVGVLGSASLFADFTNLTIDSNVKLSVDGNVWWADGSGCFRSQNCPSVPPGSFSGHYDDIRMGPGNNPVPEAPPPACASCDGNFSGFVTPGRGPSGEPLGMGMGYHLSDGQAESPTEVNGAAAFGNPQPAGD